jgi:hypothetical protein
MKNVNLKSDLLCAEVDVNIDVMTGVKIVKGGGGT